MRLTREPPPPQSAGTDRIGVVSDGFLATCFSISLFIIYVSIYRSTYLLERERKERQTVANSAKSSDSLNGPFFNNVSFSS